MEHSIPMMVEGMDCIPGFGYRLRDMREEGCRGVTLLTLAAAEVDRLGQETAWGACLESTDFETKFLEIVAKGRNGISHPSSGLGLQPDMEESPHKGTRRHNHAASSEAESQIGLGTGNPITLNSEGHDIGLLDREIREILQKGLDPELVGLLITLGSGCADAGPLGGIQHSELNPGCISIQSHHSTQRIDLTNKVALGQSSDSGITRHLSYRVGILRDQKSASPETRGGMGSLDPGMAGTND